MKRNFINSCKIYLPSISIHSCLVVFLIVFDSDDIIVWCVAFTLFFDLICAGILNIQYLLLLGNAIVYVDNKSNCVSYQINNNMYVINKESVVNVKWVRNAGGFRGGYSILTLEAFGYTKVTLKCGVEIVITNLHLDDCGISFFKSNQINFSIVNRFYCLIR